MGRPDNGAMPANRARDGAVHAMEQAGTPTMETLAIEAVPPVQVGPGCTRRDLPAPAGMRAWVVDMAPGSRWPRVDEHPHGELYLVLAGELIEGDARHGAGRYVHFQPGSAHRPRSERGARLFGINPTPAPASSESP